MRHPISTTPHQHRITTADALKALPVSGGIRFAEIFRHGTLSIEIYKPEKVDLQTPHTRDEVYVVISGSGEFLNDGVRLEVGVGDFLFAPAYVEHRFENFTDNFAVWVLFYGPEGGEPEQPN
jgi:mannose-6-phosphate isomerase-like protein (cupin superfamily)